MSTGIGSPSDPSANSTASQCKSHRPAKGLLFICALLAAGAGLLFSWAMWWPAGDCSDPGCARERFALSIEVDAFAQVPPIDFEVLIEGERISLQSILMGGGIDVQLSLDQLELPFKESSGALDRADLYQFVAQWRDRSPPSPGTDARLYALLTTALVSDNGEPLFGIMFDLAGREGFAVAPLTTARYFREREPELVSALQMRTFLHELLHALNRDHKDAVSMADGRLTLEAPTRCISDTQRRQWSLREPPLLALSPATIRFFQNAASRDVLPGVGNSPFEHRRISPTECDDARANSVLRPLESRWQFALRRIKSLLSVQAATAAQAAPGESEPVQDQPLVELNIQMQPAVYPLGYPVAMRIVARNTTTEPLPLEGRLGPGYAMVSVEYRLSGEPEWRSLQPLTFFEPANDAQAMLAPGERTEQTVPIYFGDDGWTFAAPGTYEIRARMQVDMPANDVTSNIAIIEVGEPTTTDDREALQPLLDSQGQLSNDVGRLLSFGGRIGKPYDLTPLEKTARDYGHTALGSALRLTLLSQRLRRPIDPLTGERPAPDFSAAHDLIQDTCTDSGVAALADELLQQQREPLPSVSRNRAETAAAAWDGTNAAGTTFGTYSDSSLIPWGSSLHFCFNESDLQRPVSISMASIARQLKRERAARIVLVGHGDHAGTCRFNDALALRRAQSVKNALVAAGIRSRLIEVTTLGERRPLDFASGAEAHELNRRVEILIEPSGAAALPAQSLHRIMPVCAKS